MRTLIVGDPHCTQQELDDCLALKGLVLQTIRQKGVELLVITGDLYNSHSTLNSAVIDYWNCFFTDVISLDVGVVCVLGNHDQYSPTLAYPHALICHKDVVVVDEPMEILPGVAGLPYFADPAKFLEAATALANSGKGYKTLLCHQTFDGAQFSEGFYAKDAVNPAAVPFEFIISGHIHSEHAFSNVIYPGSPRHRTLSDANQDRFLYLGEFSGGVFSLLEKVPTFPTCKKIVKFTDQEGTPTDFTNIPPNADVRVDIYGSADYISKKMVEYKAAVGARCRSFPTKTKNAKLSEADGIVASFNKFSDSFVPPKGTDLKVLVKEAGERLDRVQ